MATAIVYASNSGRIRRIISQAPTRSLRGHVDDGESMILWSAADFATGDLPDLDAANKLLSDYLGRAIPSSRCCVLDGGLTVQAVILADPLLDQLDGMLLVQDDTALVGDVLQDDGTFLTP